MNNRALALLVLVMAIALFSAYVNPTWNGGIAETKLAIEGVDKALASADEYKNKQDTLAATKADIDPTNLARLDKFLPDSVDNVSLIIDVNALAARSGFSLSTIDVAASAAGAAANIGFLNERVSPIGSVDLSLSAVGTYSAFHKFIEGLERSQRLLDVRNLTVTGSDSGIYTYAMTVRIYWLR